MKQLFSKVVATFIYHSTNATYNSTKCKSCFRNKYNRRKDFTTPETPKINWTVRRKDFATPEKPTIKWTDEQSLVLDAVSSGKSVFVTGSSGTGKTALIQEIIRRLEKFPGESWVYMTASTGIAACTLDGMTLQSFAGTRFGNSDFKSLISRVLSNTRACERWKNVEALVIDECCFIHGDYFESLEQIAREVRGVNKVWGGIQLVVGGDIFQSSPIANKKSKAEKKFVFKADCWNAIFDLQIELTIIFRQSDDDLVRLLQGIRRGKCDAGNRKLLRKCCSRPKDPSAVQLYPRIEDVNRVNKKHLLSSGRKTTLYTARDGNCT